jgi:hypothetical protein
MAQYIFNVHAFWLWSNIFDKRMALKWPRRISTHWRTNTDYENHVLSTAKYVVLAYVTVGTPVHIVGQCLVLFEPDCLVRDYTSLKAMLGSGWGGGVRSSRPVFKKQKTNETRIPLTGTNLWEYKINLWEQLISIFRLPALVMTMTFPMPWFWWCLVCGSPKYRCWLSSLSLLPYFLLLPTSCKKQKISQLLPFNLTWP